MTASIRNFALACTVLAMNSLASAQTAPGVTLRFARVVAPDLDKAVLFYKNVFGLQEVNRLSQPRNLVQLNFGATVSEARANPASQIVIAQLTGDETVDKVSHLAFVVPDANAIIEKAKQAGGSLAGGPIEAKMPDATRIIAYIKDPAGNELEIISVKK